LHQIGRAYETARELGATGNSLNKLFQSAIHTTKRIKTETNLSKLSCNIPFLAMKQVQRTFDDLENRTVYIVGLGEMGSLMLKYVQEYTTNIFASSKTFANAEKFADVLTPVRFEDRYSVIGKCDVVILCSACQEPIVTKDEFEKATLLGSQPASDSAERPKGALDIVFERHCSKVAEHPGVSASSRRLVIDLGSPRNAEASIGEIPGVEYVCVDDLEKIVSENRRLRMVELEAAQKILKEGIDEFLHWNRMDNVSKQISLHAEHMLNVANEESEKLLRSMPDLAEEDRHRISMMYERFAKKLANDYLYKVKAENAPENVQVFLKCLEAIHE
jgi:glutamyl-tRNA reductase